MAVIAAVQQLEKKSKKQDEGKKKKQQKYGPGASVIGKKEGRGNEETNYFYKIPRADEDDKPV